jgi:hypothetical protein
MPGNDRLVMVNKVMLSGLQDNLRQMIEQVRRIDTTMLLREGDVSNDEIKESLRGIWMMLGCQNSVLDVILTELVNGADDA